MDYFGDGSGNSPVTGQPFGVHIEYYFENEPLGNAGALFKIKDKLTEDFLLLNADAMFDVDFNRFVEYHKQHGGLVTLFTHPNSHPYDSGLIVADLEDLRIPMPRARTVVWMSCLIGQVLEIGITKIMV